MVRKPAIVFVGSELAPFAKVGGLGDVMEGLPKALSVSGLDVSVVIPKYECIDTRRIKSKIVVKNFPIFLGGHRVEYITLHQTTLPTCAVRIYLIENKKYLSAGGIYFDRTAFAGSFKEIQRFLFFSKSVMALFVAQKLRADIMHCNDWHTGALAQLIRKYSDPSRGMQQPKTVFTIHNLANQGVWNSRNVTAWFGDTTFKNEKGKFNFMAEGIRRADMVTTVSESYAREMVTPRYGVGLEKLLAKRAAEEKLKGILNGIDYSMWPIVKRDKTKFQKKLGFVPDEGLPLFGLVARLTYQKGISLIVPVVKELAQKKKAQFVFLGRGEVKNEKMLQTLAREYPRFIYTDIRFDEKLAHEIYAQSDFFLMPSLFEPSGLGQLISMHYGTIPIVRATGGLKDSVIDLKTGFVFEQARAISFGSTMERALACYNNKSIFNKIRTQCRAQDFSWRRSAEKYSNLYVKLLENNSG